MTPRVVRTVEEARAEQVARAALTAARPLMEAEIRGQVAAQIRAVANDPERRRPRELDAKFPTDLANDFEWCAQIAAATIAERTQR